MNENLSKMLEIVFTTPLEIGVVKFPFTLLELILKLVLPLLLAVLVYRFLNKVLFRLVDYSKMRDELKESFKKWVRIILRILYLIALIAFVGGLFGAKIFEYFGIVFATLNQPLIQTGSTNITFITVLFTIPVFYLSAWAGKASRRLVNRSFLYRMGFDEAQQFSITNLLRYTVMVLVLLIGLSIIGINFSALTVIFGVLGIGLGFGLQSVVSNFFSGLLIIITRPVKEGDRILVNNLEGDIVQIRMISTVINTLSNENIIIPNSYLVGDVVHNLSYNNPSIIIRNDIGVSYASDVDRVLEVLNEVAKRNPFRVVHREPFVRLKEFGDSGINFAVFTWINSNLDKYEAHHWNNVEIWRALKEGGIEIPFPQVDLHVRK